MRNEIITILAIFVAMIGLAAADTGQVKAVDEFGNIGNAGDNNFLIGTMIYINTDTGSNFQANRPYIWQIRDEDNGLNVLAEDTSYSLSTNNDGKIILQPTGWSIPTTANDGHQYRLDVTVQELDYIGNPQNNIQEISLNTKRNTFSAEIPEFPTVALPIAAVIGLVFFFQNKKRKEE